MTEREAFEAWFIAQYIYEDTAREQMVRSGPDYLRYETSAQWKAWQASRQQALEEVAALFPQPHIEYFGDAIADAIRSLTSPIGDKA